MTKTIELDGIKYELVPISDEPKKENSVYPDRPKDGDYYYSVLSNGNMNYDRFLSEYNIYYPKTGNCFFDDESDDNAEKQAKAYKLLIDKVWDIREKYGEIENTGKYYYLETFSTWGIEDDVTNFNIYETINSRLGLILHISSTEQERKEVLALLLAVYNKDFSRVDELKLLD